MKVELINYSGSSCNEAISICHNTQLESEKEQNNLLVKVLNSGHSSILEFADFTFKISEVSRSLTHQLVRHRIASYAQQSQRFVTPESSFVIPPKIRSNKKALTIFNNSTDKALESYEKLIKEGIPKEDARYLLPNATYTYIIVKMNARTLNEFFNLRCCNHAQWEIRKMANKMLKICRDIEPLLFFKDYPDCKNCNTICDNPINKIWI